MDRTKQRSHSFNQVAQLYDLARPSYPPQLIDEVETLAQLDSTAQILEVGTGTGKATLPFAQRGYRIHCLELGHHLAAKAAENLRAYPAVTIETIAFEAWPVESASYDLVLSAQAFHWIDPDVGYTKAAQALKPKGHIALMWTLNDRADSTLFEQLDQAYKTHANRQMNPFAQQIEARSQALIASHQFAEPIVRHYPWLQRYSTQQYLDLVQTQSDYLILPADQQQALLKAIITIIENNNDGIDITYTTMLLLAKKAAAAA